MSLNSDIVDEREYIMKKSKSAGRKRATFRIKADPGSKVYVCGSFNDWNGDAKEMKDSGGKGEYTAVLFLPPGRYEYKFVINGEWHIDPACADWVLNDFGTLNSVLVV